MHLESPAGIHHVLPGINFTNQNLDAKLDGAWFLNCGMIHKKYLTP
jgi:hypothetical protein